MEYQTKLQSFIKDNKTLLIAPAGYGKTYTIAECLKLIDKKVLILTHTHAGVASLKNRIKSNCLPSSKYQVETITSYAQKYVKSFYNGELPNITDKSYWNCIQSKATEIFKLSHIKEIINVTYSHLFIDEYQDCDTIQHSLILTLSDIIPTHILGDPLQGVIDFNGGIINFEKDLTKFNRTCLEIPHRWYQNGNNKELGDSLKEIRKILEDNLENDSCQAPSFWSKFKESILAFVILTFGAGG